MLECLETSHVEIMIEVDLCVPMGNMPRAQAFPR